MFSIVNSTYAPSSILISELPKSSFSAMSVSPPSAQHAHAYLDDETLFCDWTLSATHCRDEHITWNILVASSILHIFITVYSIWLMVQRNGSMNRTIVTSLFVRIGTRIQPRPVRDLSSKDYEYQVTASLTMLVTDCWYNRQTWYCLA